MGRPRFLQVQRIFSSEFVRHLEKIKIPELRRVNCEAMNGLGRSPRPVPKRSRDSVVPGGPVFKARHGAHTGCM